MLKEGHLRGLRIPRAVSTNTQGSGTAGASGDVVKAVHFRVLKILPGPSTPEGTWCCLLLCKKDSLRRRRLCTPCRFCLAVCSSHWPPTTPSTAIWQPQLPPCILDCDCSPGSSWQTMGQRQPCCVVLLCGHSSAWGSSTAHSDKT